MSKLRPVSFNATSPFVQTFFKLLNQTDMKVDAVAEQAQLDPGTIWSWASKRWEPGLGNFEAALNVLGYKLVIQPKEDTK